MISWYSMTGIALLASLSFNLALSSSVMTEIEQDYTEHFQVVGIYMYVGLLRSAENV